MMAVINFFERYGVIIKALVVSVLIAFTLSIVFSLMLVFNIVDISTVENLLGMRIEFDIVDAFLKLISKTFM